MKLKFENFDFLRDRHFLLSKYSKKRNFTQELIYNQPVISYESLIYDSGEFYDDNRGMIRILFGSA